jgi:Phospholipase A2-like domain
MSKFEQNRRTSYTGNHHHHQHYRRRGVKSGSGLINSIINKLPVELHLPGYQYCGPGTRLQKRISRGDPGINELDRACKEHDIAYTNQDLASRHKADHNLELAAWNRVKSKYASFKEKAAAWFVTNSMKMKRKLGMGLKATTSNSGRKPISRCGSPIRKMKKIAFGSGIVKKVRNDLKKHKNKNDINEIAKVALLSARKHLRAVGGKRNIRMPRIIPIPKVGGFLPLIPIFAGLSALGSLAGAAANISRAVKAARANDGNKVTPLNKTGSGLYLKPYRKGLGLYIKPSKNF